MSKLTKSEQDDLIYDIPDYQYTKEEIIKIIKFIRDGVMVSIEQLPNYSKKMPKVKLSDVVIDKRNLKNLTEDERVELEKLISKKDNLTARLYKGTTPNQYDRLEKEVEKLTTKIKELRKKKKTLQVAPDPEPIPEPIPEPKPAPKAKPLKPVVKQGRPKKIKTKEQIKAEEKEIADKLKAKESKLKPYFKIGVIPKGFRRASMLEAKEAGKINYWGVQKVDNKILNLTDENDPKKLQLKIKEKNIKLAGLVGRMNRLKKEIVTAKNNNDNKEEKKLTAEYDETKKNVLEVMNQMNQLKEKLKKRSGTGFTHESDDDADSDTDNVTD